MIATRPLIVLRDCTLLVDIRHVGYEGLRVQLIQFAELLKSPEGYHTYRLTRLSLWNAVSLGWTPQRVISLLQESSRSPIPVGRILRPKKEGGKSYFYSIVSRDSRDQERAIHRQMFLTEQGYSYIHLDGKDVLYV